MTDLPFTGTTQRQRLPHAEIPGCALVQDLIPLYLDGEVTHESHVLMAEHLQRCERCSGYLAGARSVRSEILSEQQSIRAAGAPQPTNRLGREPVGNSLAMTLWQSLMVLLYGLGLFFGLIAAQGTGFRPLPGLVLVVAGLAGLLAVDQGRTRTWLVLMLGTGLSGVLLILLALAVGGDRSSLLIVYGLGVVGLGSLGVFLHHLQRPASAAPATYSGGPGAQEALLTAFFSIVGVAVCAVAAFGSLLGLVEGARGDHLGQMVFAGLRLTVSAWCMLLIMQQRGWLRAVITQRETYRLLGSVLLLVGLVALLAKLI